MAASPVGVFFLGYLSGYRQDNGGAANWPWLSATQIEGVKFLEGRIIREDTLSLMHGWRKWHFPLDYGYGTIRFRLPNALGAILKVRPLWGHSGSTGSFLYYSEDLDIYMAGTINQTESQSKPFVLLIKAIRLIQAKSARSSG